LFWPRTTSVCTGSMEAAPQGRAGGVRRSRVNGITADELGLPFLFLLRFAKASGWESLASAPSSVWARRKEPVSLSTPSSTQSVWCRLMPRQRTRRAERTGMHRMHFASRLHLIFFRRGRAVWEAAGSGRVICISHGPLAMVGLLLG
jgi:hypothetical protein